MTPEQQVLRLLDRNFEGRFSEDHKQELNELLRSHPRLVDTYCDYMALHGSLHWDTGCSGATVASQGEAARVTALTSTSTRRSQVLAAATVLAACLIGLVGWQLSKVSEKPQPVVQQPENQPARSDTTFIQTDERVASNGSVNTSESVVDVQPKDLKPLNTQVVPPASENGNQAVVARKDEQQNQPRFAARFSDSDVVQHIDRLLKQSWDEQEIEPSERADDWEWVRRAYLVYAGRIPGSREVREFMDSPEQTRREKLIDQLTQSDEMPEYLADVWTQLLIGRTNRPGVNRAKLQEYLVARFSQDAPWIDTVSDLITARGRNDRNGATNFLLAHLNNQATPATAVTARLFLGQQISCVQCHDHPFAKGIRQQDYWALNAFFKDTQKVSVPVADASKKKAMPNVPWKLEDRPGDDPMTYFESRSGLKIAVLPSFGGQTLDHRSRENRRDTLAQLLSADSETTVARAMVNRMWAHFFGYGFTVSVDDMGPHVPVSHPELLETLTEAFVKSDYSLTRLMKWIALSDAWQRSSLQSESALADSPEIGEVPLFSRVYARRMSPEQVYESIRVGIQSVGDQPLTSRQDHADHRREWVRQFATSYGTDENDEAVDFEGTISQAMVMMNGSEVNEAIRAASGTLVRNQKGATVRSLESLAVALLTREPTELERKAFRRRAQQLSRSNAQAGSLIAVEDMLWAYLNSTEFMTVH